MGYKPKETTEEYDVVVCGGGLAGFCAAVSAARHGVRTCIIQDRPVFGGNSSSEIRVKPLGADRYHVYGRETGIISELLIEERAINHSELFTDNGVMNSVWDMILYNVAVTTPNLIFHLNTSVTDVIMNSTDEIKAVVCRVANAELEITVYGKIFLDCTGDSILSVLAGCEWRMGEEARSEFNEPHAPIEASQNTMGNSLHFTAKDMGVPVPYTPPEWAVKYDDPAFFYDTGRIPYNQKGGFWWLEIGAPWHTIYDNETIRHELTCHTLGVWDWIKNKDPRLKEAATNWALDWIGQVPGKRESRRIMGMHLMTEHDVAQNPDFHDEIAYGGFYIDLHTIGGLRAEISEPVNAADCKEDYHGDKSEAAVTTYVTPYGIPLRILISKDIKNLMMAGRNISATHVALGTLRVMSTTSLMGQAAGTAAAITVKKDMEIRNLSNQAIMELQQTLLKDGCFLPHHKNEDPLDLAKSAAASAQSSAKLRGAGPNNRNWVNDHFPFVTSYPAVLNQRISQWISIGKEGLRSISICLNNDTDQAQNVRVCLMPSEHIWDYNEREEIRPYAETILEVKPGRLQWIDWELDTAQTAELKPGHYMRLDLFENSKVSWQTAGTVEPCHMAGYEIAAGKLRKYEYGLSMSFKVVPEQSVFEAENALSGVTRPHTFTNLWRSDPAIPLPVWFQLQWEQPQRIGLIQITFQGNFLFEYGNYHPMYKDPEVAKDYNVCAFVDGEWVELVSIRDNYQCCRRHNLAATVMTDKIRINIFSTNGDPSAGIYEVRCYDNSYI